MLYIRRDEFEELENQFPTANLPLESDPWEICREYVSTGFKPYEMVYYRLGPSQYELLELISFPFCEDNGIYIMVREKDEPTTIKSVNIHQCFLKDGEG